MKKRIIITALSVMLASSSIIPAYAALPEGAPAVDVETATMDDIRNSAKQWASQYVEELKQIENPKDRYRRMVELVVTNWMSLDEDGIVFDMRLVTEQFNSGKVGDTEYRAIFEYWAETTGTPCGAQYVFFNNIPLYIPYYEENGVKTYSLIETMRAYGIINEYMFAPMGTCGLRQIGGDTPGQIYSKGEFGDVVWHRLRSKQRKSNIYVYSGDMSVPNIIISKGDIDDYCTADTIFYKAVDGIFTPLTREEAVALGYDGID